ncbi:MAG: ferritin family protein [candidate division Zixibacteria bacterium]|nr:ferritin family protein [candidate division Zixibacteria bacterium]
MKFDSVDKILDFAIQKEQDAADFYTGLAGEMEHEHMKDVFLGFADEERGHKTKLMAIKDGKQMVSAEQKVQDLEIGDHLVDIELKTELSYQEALILAMKAEKAAFRLYNDLASATDDANLKSTFLGLAQEEAKHKLRFEIEYDDSILTEN